MKFSILIILLWLNPVDDTGNAFVISELNGQRLLFDTQDQCFDHVQENYDDIESFIETYYDNKATVSEALCVKGFD